MMPLLTKPTTMTVVALEALDDGGHAQTEEEALEGVIGQLAQDLLQMAAGLFLKGFAHDVHAEQEQSQTAQQRKDIE